MIQEFDAQAVRGYELREVLGEGGYGAVYRAYQPQVGREVAIKIILPQYANHPEFIRRFESEAQLVARLEHPYIVPLYDYWREPDGAFLVMRWLRGGSLYETLQRGPLPADALPRLLDQIGGALSAAHRRSVIHRDLKPANILLDEDGNAYLADFGIAKDLGKKVSPYQTDQTSVVGSPAYISPEQVRAETITPQTDIYSLGVMLFEILTGVLPFQAPTPIALMFKHINEPVPVHPALSDGVNAVIQKATAKIPADRYPDVATMLAELRLALGIAPSSGAALAFGGSPSPTTPPITGGTTTGGRRSTYETNVIYLPTFFEPIGDQLVFDNPYKGLRAFQEADASDFFGRDALIDTLLDRLNQPGPFQRFLAVVGPSGSGKSSVVRAGVVPALKHAAIPGSDKWYVLEFFPGARPFDELAQALLRIAVDPPNNLVEPLTLDRGGLLRVVDQVVPGGDETEVVLVIDQFEELFTQVEDESVRTLFLDSLISAVTDPYSRVRVIATLRADFYDRPLLYPGLSELMRARTEVVIPLTESELKQAIVQPAERAGLRVDPELVEAIVSDVGEQPGALPLLQYALTEVFERRNGRTLTLTPYHGSGGVLGALARRAEEIFTSLNEAEQAVAQQLFLRLVTLGEGVEDTRRRVRRTELLPVGGDAAAIDRVIDTFVQYRLLTLDVDPQTRAPTVEVAHEALIRTWARLRGWLDASREDVRQQRRLASAATEWAVSGQERSFLASGARLEQLAGWAAETPLALNAEEQAYLAASVAARDERTAAEAARAAREARLEAQSKTFLRALVGVASVAAVAGLLLALFAFSQRSQAYTSAQQAKASADQAKAEAQRADTNARRAETEATNAQQQKLAAERSAAEAKKLALAAGAQAALNKGNTDLALSLAIAANTGDAQVTQSEAVLSEAAYARGTHHVYSQHKAGVQAVVFGPNDETFLSASDDKTLILWDRASNEPIRTFSGHAGKLLSVSISADGTRAVSSDDKKLVLVWDVATGKATRELTGHLDLVNDVALSPDGTTAATASKDSTIKLWNIETGEVIRTFTGHTQPVQSIAFSPDGSKLLSGSMDTTMRLWDANTGAQLETFEGHTRSVWDAEFSPDGTSAVSTSEDRTIIQWDLTTGEQIHLFRGHTNDVWKARFSPDGKLIVSSSRDTRLGLWNPSTGDFISFLNGHGGSVRDFAFTKDGDQVLSASIDGTLRLWDLTTGGQIGTFTGHSDSINRLLVSADGKTALSASSDGRVFLWEIATGAIVRTFAGHDGAVFGAALSPDGSKLVTGGQDKTVIVWNVADGSPLHVLKHHTDGVSAVAVSPDGTTALSSGVDKSILLWDITSGSLIKQFDGHTDQVFYVTFSPDGKTFLSASGDSQVIHWDIASGKELSRFKGHTATVRQVVFSNDGATALSSGDDRLVLLWEVASGRILHRMVGHTAAVRAVAFSPDGTTALSGSTDTDVILWELATGNAIRRFSGHTGIVRAVAWAPDGHTAYSGATDGVVRSWRIDNLNELINWTRAHRHIPDLTCDQAAYYQLELSGCSQN